MPGPMKHPNTKTWWEVENKLDKVYGQGENPDLTESDCEKIRDHQKKAAKIHGHGLPKCSNCGHPVYLPAGTCGICEYCGSEIGGCGL